MFKKWARIDTQISDICESGRRINGCIIRKHKIINLFLLRSTCFRLPRVSSIRSWSKGVEGDDEGDGGDVGVGKEYAVFRIVRYTLRLKSSHPGSTLICTFFLTTKLWGVC